VTTLSNFIVIVPSTVPMTSPTRINAHCITGLQ
jgi:hypothetical protein